MRLFFMMDAHTNDDLEFARRCVSGDPKAWDDFIDRYAKLLYSAVYATLRLKGCSVRMHEYAGDIFQDVIVFLRNDAFKKLATFQGRNGCSLATWLRLVTVRYTIDYLRKQRTSVSLDAADESGRRLADLLASGGISARDSVIEKDVLLKLSECVDRLSGEDKYCLELLFYQRLMPVEVARTLGVSRQVVDVRKMRLLEKLRTCFQKKGLLDL